MNCSEKVSILPCLVFINLPDSPLITYHHTLKISISVFFLLFLIRGCYLFRGKWLEYQTQSFPNKINKSVEFCSFGVIFPAFFAILAGFILKQPLIQFCSDSSPSAMTQKKINKQAIYACQVAVNALRQRGCFSRPVWPNRAQSNTQSSLYSLIDPDYHNHSHPLARHNSTPTPTSSRLPPHSPSSCQRVPSLNSGRDSPQINYPASVSGPPLHQANMGLITGDKWARRRAGWPHQRRADDPLCGGQGWVFAGATASE